MRTKVGAVLAFIGGFLVVLAVLIQVFAAGQLRKTPLDVNSTTHLAGTAELSNGTKIVSTPVIATQVTKSNTARSDGDVLVMENSTCLIKAGGPAVQCVSAKDPRKRLLSATTDIFATDRVTAMAVNDPQYLPADAVPHEGLINKWPFDAENKTYPYWDTTLRKAVDATYVRTSSIDGVTAKIYKEDVKDQPAEISDGVKGTYSETKEIWVEPTTGSIINQTEHRELVDSNGNPFLTLDLAFTDAEVKASSEDAKSSADQLNLVTKTLPLVGYLVGLPLLLIGIALMFLGLKREEEPIGEVPADRNGASV